MVWRIVIALCLVCSTASADRLTEILFDFEKSRAFTASFARSVVVISITPKQTPLASPIAVQPTLALAVALKDRNDRLRLVTSGLVTQDAGQVHVTSPSGREVRAHKIQSLGDGALSELVTRDPFLNLELLPLDLAPGDVVKRTLPVFTIGNIHTQNPVIARGVVHSRLEKPWDYLIACDFKFPFGTPLFTVDRTLAAVAFRRHPREDKLTLAVASEAIRAWLHTEDSTADSR